MESSSPVPGDCYGNHPSDWPRRTDNLQEETEEQSRGHCGKGT